jgi:hypothetical protein
MKKWLIAASAVGAVGLLAWADEGEPWALFRTEEVVYNVDVADLVRARGL